MKQKLLLSLAITTFTLTVSAQKATTAFAITGAEKGSSNWTEVRLVDINSGNELKTIYQNSQEMEILNARTGKAVAKKDVNKDIKDNVDVLVRSNVNTNINNNVNVTVKKDDNVIITKTSSNHYEIIRKDPSGNIHVIVRDMNFGFNQSYDRPFATKSAAMAFDKKHDRLYYTPMGINQLRYIDLKSKTPRIYYFEDEDFGVVKNFGDASNQITRMVIASDGNGYALSNNGNHLIQFTTNKKATITDLGALSDDASNGAYSVHSPNGYGGDMIADDAGDLYLITANRAVFKIKLDTKVATYKGSIQGLPRGYSTNGAAVEEGTKVIVASSNSTIGYFRFDMNTLVAEKVSSEGNVFGASDLANSNLLSEKKKKKEEPVEERKEPEVKPEVSTPQTVRPVEEMVEQGKISVYPNPVTTGATKLAFQDYPQGKYEIQFMDISGKIMSSKSVTINYKSQVEELKLPDLVAKGNYVVKVADASGKIMSVTKLVVQ